MYAIIKKTGIVIGIVAAAVALVIAGLYSFRQFVLSEPNVIQKIESPTSEYVAYVFESNGGATSGFVYRLSILPADKTLKKSTGNTYISDYIFDVEWTGDRELQVNNTSPIRIYKQKENVQGVNIHYKYLKQ